MKKLTIALLTIAAMLTGTQVFAQGKYGADSAECIKNLSFYSEYFKQKNYDEAMPSWRQAYKLCPPTASQNLYINGATLLRQMISKNAKDAKYRNALVDSLLTLYDIRAQYYPNNAVAALNNKGQDLFNYVKNDPKKLYDGFEGIIAANQEKIRPTLLLFDLQAAIDLFQAGQLDAETVINAYQRNSDLLETIKPANDADKEQVANVKNDMGSVFAASKVASCETLVELYTPRLAADPDNLTLAQSIVKTMSITEGCDDNDLFLQAVTTMNKLDPSPSSSYYLSRLHGGRGHALLQGRPERPRLRVRQQGGGRERGHGRQGLLPDRQHLGRHPLRRRRDLPPRPLLGGLRLHEQGEGRRPVPDGRGEPLHRPVQRVLPGDRRGLHVRRHPRPVLYGRLRRNACHDDGAYPLV